MKDNLLFIFRNAQLRNSLIACAVYFPYFALKILTKTQSVPKVPTMSKLVNQRTLNVQQGNHDDFLHTHLIPLISFSNFISLKIILTNYQKSLF